MIRFMYHHNLWTVIKMENLVFKNFKLLLILTDALQGNALKINVSSTLYSTIRATV